MKWSISYHVSSLDRFNRSDPCAHADFESKNFEEGKIKVLNWIKHRVSRLRHMRHGRWFQIIAAPYLPHSNILDGAQLVRVRRKYGNKRILKITDPDVAFVYGYGAKQWDELSK